MKSASLLLSSLTLAATLAAPPAHAVGRLVDVQVIDRDSGQQLPVYRHDGEWWVAGRPGARYAIQLRNASGERVMGVMAVDGVNVITGDTADWNQSGYVLPGWQHAQITGWRKSDAEVAAFHFTALPHSYAARTGRPGDVGVIGVAVFREQARPRPAPPVAPARVPAPDSGENAASADATGAPAPSSARPPAEAETAARAHAPEARLGTGHGEREASPIRSTRFERRASSPDEIISIRYDRRENLVAAGILPVDAASPRRPRAFPASAGYVPDPPAWR